MGHILWLAMTGRASGRNTGNAAGFSVVDPGGNWLRIFHNTDAADDSTDEPASQLAKAMRNAVVLGDSRGDTRQAARILDGALTRHRESAPAPTRWKRSSTARQARDAAR